MESAEFHAMILNEEYL